MLRSTFAAALFWSLAFAPGCRLTLEADPSGGDAGSTADAGPGGGSGVGGGGAAAGGSGGGAFGGGSPRDGGPSQFLTDCRAYYAEDCASNAAPNPPSPLCLALSANCEQWDVSVTRGYQIYDAKALARCRRGIATRTLSLVTPDSVPQYTDYRSNEDEALCGRWLWPQVANGNVCYSAGDCAHQNATCMSTTSQCPLTCVWQDPHTEPGLCSTECKAGEYCVYDGGCQPGGLTGDACQFDPECDRTKGLRCEPTTHKCIDVFAIRNTGESCGLKTPCPSGEACIGLSVGLDGYHPGTCGAPALGDECQDFSVCPPASRCRSADGGYVVGHNVGACVAVGLGSRCDSDVDCLNKHFCAVSPGVCTQRIAPGASCAADAGMCAVGTMCAETLSGELKCVSPGTKDQPCAETTADPARCAAGLLCLGGVCKETGLLGEPCFFSGSAYSGCFNSRCAFDAGAYDAGLGIPIGRCVEYPPPGPPCTTSSDCAVGVCRGGGCDEPCP